MLQYRGNALYVCYRRHSGTSRVFLTRRIRPKNHLRTQNISNFHLYEEKKNPVTNIDVLQCWLGELPSYYICIMSTYPKTSWILFELLRITSTHIVDLRYSLSIQVSVCWEPRIYSVYRKEFLDRNFTTVIEILTTWNQLFLKG